MGWRVRAPRQRRKLEVAACHAPEAASALWTSRWRLKSALVGRLRRNLGQRFTAILWSHLRSSCEHGRTAPLSPRLRDLIKTDPRSLDLGGWPTLATASARSISPQGSGAGQRLVKCNTLQFAARDSNRKNGVPCPPSAVYNTLRLSAAALEPGCLWLHSSQVCGA